MPLGKVQREGERGRGKPEGGRPWVYPSVCKAGRASQGGTCNSLTSWAAAGAQWEELTPPLPFSEVGSPSGHWAGRSTSRTHSRTVEPIDPFHPPHIKQAELPERQDVWKYRGFAKMRTELSCWVSGHVLPGYLPAPPGGVDPFVGPSVLARLAGRGRSLLWPAAGSLPE